LLVHANVQHQILLANHHQSVADSILVMVQGHRESTLALTEE